jgi:dinuclear metal center YbgI/SA1388 family protein
MKWLKMKPKTTLNDVAGYFETLAPAALQESYDNAGIQVGDPEQEITSALVTIDVTEAVVDEAISCGANLIVSHHPVIFGNLKRITGATATERILRKAIIHSIAILSVHTNLDNVAAGVNAKMAQKLGLKEPKVLKPMKGILRKLVTFVPLSHLEVVRDAIFKAGAGHIGNYDQCSFNSPGKGTFRGDEGTHPFTGEPEKFHTEDEIRVETIFPVYLESKISGALIRAHPYEEVAYDIYPVENSYMLAGAGLVGNLGEPLPEKVFLKFLKETFHSPVIRHSPLMNKLVSRVAVCGGAGSFLTGEAIAAGADFFISGDVKYHQFFEAAGKIVLADIGHFESEQFTRELFYELLTKKFHTFGVRFSETVTSPVSCFF